MIDVNLEKNSNFSLLEMFGRTILNTPCFIMIENLVTDSKKYEFNGYLTLESILEFINNVKLGK
jgi:hypothetical protein